MPFLSPVAGTSASTGAVELRSSKTLIGSGQSKCGVVLPAERGVLDLHALFNLSTGNAAATIVPFSAATEGACFLNGRLVPAQGATVVHGDRVAFGSADTAFVFTLTEPSTKASDPRASDNSRSFRRTLDSLRGDRDPVVSSSQNAPLPRKREAQTKALKASGSRERLERFLLDASTDSLLGDYVERKLRASTSSTGKPRRGQRPKAMEPPPSLSASTVSSLQSSLADSILDRSALEQVRESKTSIKQDTLEQSQSLLSTAERNYAEIEKLRLSQRLREVNNVLNGHLNFDSSYLTKERRSSGSDSMRFESPLKSSVKRSRERAKDADNQSDQDEEEDDDDLPAMVEKPQQRRQENPPSLRSSVLQDKVHAVKSSITTLLGEGLTEEPPKPIADASNEKDDETEVALDESLPSFSEAILKRRSTATPTEPVADPRRAPSKSAVSITAPRVAEGRVRTQLHQQLIDRTLRQKRQEVLSEGFIRWRRGLRVQEQRRRDKAQKQQMVIKKLTLLRRNRMYAQWKEWAERKQQVRQCREEALLRRQQTRLVRTVWVRWWVSSIHGRHRRNLLRRVVAAIRNSLLRVGFQRWKRHADKKAVARMQEETLESHQQALERRMEGVAVRHHQLRGKTSKLTRIFRAWRSTASQTRLKKRVLYRMIQLVFRRSQLRAWTTWRQNVMMIRHALEAESRRKKLVEEAQATAEQQHKSQQTKYDMHMKDLQEKIDELQRQVNSHEEEQREKSKQAAANKARAKAQWIDSLEKLLEASIAQADTRIAEVSSRLESFLQQMDAEPEAARFQSATFLVESMLQQKLHHVNERVRAQESLLQGMKTSSHDIPTEKQRDGGGWKKALTTNARHLLDMVHQRYARLHQLYHAIAKLAATRLDPPSNGGGVRTDTVKFKHAAFLTDTMHERANDHLDALLSIHYRRCELGITPVTVQAEGDGREARKY